MLTISNPDTFDWANIPLHDCIVGNAFDARNTLILYHIILDLLKKEGLEHFYETVLSPAASMFAEVEYEGIDIDTEERKRLDTKLRLDLLALEDQIVELAGKSDFNINSDQQVAKLLYEDDDGFGLVPIKFTPKKAISVDSDVIKTTKAMILSELARRCEKT